MNLTDALDGAAHTATADRPGLDAGRVLHRIRRRRVARTATQGTLGIAAVGLLAFGGSRLPLWDQTAPAPPAGPDPTTSAPAPAPAPTTSAPIPVLPVPGVACGQSFADVLALAEPGVTLDFAPNAPEALPDATTDWENTGRLTMTATEPDGPHVMPDVLAEVVLVVVSGDTVIGFGGVHTESTGPDATDERGIAADVRAAFLACTADGALGGPLAGGIYQAYAVLPVTVADGTDDVREGFVVSDPAAVPISVASEPEDDPASAYLWLPECGDSTAGLTATAGPLTGSTEAAVGVGDVQTGTFRETGSGDVMRVRTAVTNSGPDLTEALSLVTEGVLAEDGTVVATWFDVGGDLPPVDWPAGTPRDGADGIFALERCDGFGDLPPGSYTVWSMSIAGGLDSWGDPPLRVIHQPAELRITE